MSDITATIKRNLLDNKLVCPGEKVLVAFSGGPDSIALLHILNSLSKNLKIKLTACYINHNIRPRAAKNEIKFCSRECNKLKIPFILVEGDIPQYARDMKLSIEEAGREFRYMILKHIATSKGFKKIAVGQHQDDIIETILFRLFRGTGPQGLEPIRPMNGNIIRPLYNISRKEIIEYLKKRKIGYLTDQSNLKSSFSRNYIRNKIIPLIEKQFGPKYRSAIIKFARIIIEEDSYLRNISETEQKKASRVTPGGKIILDLGRISGYDIWLKRRIIKLSLEKLTGQIGIGDFEEIERVDRVIRGELKSTNLSGTIRATRDKDYLILFRKQVFIREKELKIGGFAAIPEINSMIKSRRINPNKANAGLQKRGNKVNIDSDKVSPPLFIGGIRQGDSFSPLGMKGTKKIGDFLTDRKISRFLRDEVPVIKDSRGNIIWLVGYQISEQCKIDDRTRKVLEIEIIRKKSGPRA
jgi:tRNA(Ile)-lysidine synthase